MASTHTNKRKQTMPQFCHKIKHIAVFTGTIIIFPLLAIWGTVAFIFKDNERIRPIFKLIGKLAIGLIAALIIAYPPSLALTSLWIDAYDEEITPTIRSAFFNYSYAVSLWATVISAALIYLAHKSFLLNRSYLLKIPAALIIYVLTLIITIIIFILLLMF